MAKICIKCNLSKEDSEFRSRVNRSVNTCKQCEREYSLSRYHSDSEYRQNHKKFSENFKTLNPDYHKSYRSSYKLSSEQKDKYKLKARDYYSSNKDECLQRTKDWKKSRPNYKKELKLQKFGLTLEDYDNILIDQNNKCPICKNIFTKEFLRRPNIDHCHKTNKFRAILCHKCNTALGLFDDNIDSLREAILYLEKY